MSEDLNSQALHKVGTEGKKGAVGCKNAFKNRIQNFDYEIKTQYIGWSMTVVEKSQTSPTKHQVVTQRERTQVYYMQSQRS